MFGPIKHLFQDTYNADDDVNLLLLGETGVGKSTLVNSISNYFKYASFKEAQKRIIDILIPMYSTESRKVYGIADENEDYDEGKCTTQFVKEYMFPIKMNNRTFNLRLIDTPGVGDPRGMEQDEINLDNVLAYLTTLKKLHGICFVLKSNQTGFTKFAEYCLKQILTRLDKSASQNIIFITTYSKTESYTAGETKSHCLAPLVKDIMSTPPHANIPLSDDNVFCLDNEAFKALLASQDGKRYTKREVKGFETSWQVSSNEIQRLLRYVIGDASSPGLKPHDVENTISINEVRLHIEQLTTPIAEVLELIQDNIRVLDAHQKKLQQDDQTVEELKQQLHIPCVNLEVKELTQPVTVCTDPKCAEIVKVNNVTQWHYKQRCHNPCHLTGVPKEIIGDPNLMHCAAMANRPNCQECECPWQVHMHIYKETTKVSVRKVDQNVLGVIRSKQDARIHMHKLIEDLNTRRRELEKEGETISRIVAKFSWFLQEHAQTPFNDAYGEYIDQLIKNEKYLGMFANREVIAKLENLLSQHYNLQATFHESAKNAQGEPSDDLSLKGIQKSIAQLYKLKHMGKTIQELIQKSNACRNKETQKNFGCVTLREVVDLDKTIAEQEQFEFTESDDDVQLRQNKGSEEEMFENQCHPDGPGNSDDIKHQSNHSKLHRTLLVSDDESDSAKPTSRRGEKQGKEKMKRNDDKEHHLTIRNPTSRTQDDQQKMTPTTSDMPKEIASISDNVNNQENLMQNVYETMKKQQENVKQSMEKIGLLLESNEMENIDNLKSFLSDSEDGRNKHHQTEHSEHSESEAISKDVESATQKESPENELDYTVPYIYRTNNSEDDKSSKPRTDDGRLEYPSPERTYTDPREPRNYDARYHPEEDNRLAEASGSRNYLTRSNFSPRSTSPGRYHSTTERKSHKSDHRRHYSPRRHRRRSESYDSSDRDFRRSSRRHVTRYTDGSESYDSDDNPSRHRTRSNSYKDYDSNDDRQKQSRYVKNKSSRRRRSSDEDIDKKREKQSHRKHHKGKRSSRRHRSGSESYDSHDHESGRSSSSDSASSARSFDCRSSVKRSKDKTGRSRGSEQQRSTRTEKKSRHEVKESFRRQHHRPKSDNYDSADDRDPRKRFQRGDGKHSRREDKSVILLEIVLNSLRIIESLIKNMIQILSNHLKVHTSHQRINTKLVIQMISVLEDFLKMERQIQSLQPQESLVQLIQILLNLLQKI
ncbi:uncharacterized protein LOC135136858 isoform X2 [Zophobas morio]|uniref:uncharacterized protein LOC135136858 isoform X2 n=1 Tax=Zophobas morio TaxID=2755281 RepID=UPI0030826D07